MTGLFPSVLLQILWRRIRCLSLGPFSLYSINFVYFLLFCSKAGRSLVSGGFFPSFITVVESVLAWFARAKDIVLPTPWQFGTILFLKHDLLWAEPQGDTFLNKMWHYPWHIYHQSVMIHLLIVSIYFSNIFHPWLISQENLFRIDWSDSHSAFTLASFRLILA